MKIFHVQLPNKIAKFLAWSVTVSLRQILNKKDRLGIPINPVQYLSCCLPALTSSYIFDKKTAENEKQSVAGSNLGSKLRNNKWSERNSSLSKNICTNAHFQIPNSHSSMERFNQIFTPPDTSVITVTQDQYYSINSIKNRAIRCNIIKHHTMPCKLAEHTCICQRVGCNLWNHQKSFLCLMVVGTEVKIGDIEPRILWSAARSCECTGCR